MPVQYEPGTRNATSADIDLTAGIRGGRRGTGRPAVDMFNDKLRAEPWYQAWLASQGITGAPNLNDRQRVALTDELRKHGIPVPNGVHVDAAGNLSNPDHFGRNFGIASVAGLAGGIAAPAIIGAIGGGAAAGGGGAAAGTAGAGAGAGTAAASTAGLGAGSAAGSLGGGTGIVGAGFGGAPIVTGAAGLSGGAGAGSAAAGGGSLLSRIGGALGDGTASDIMRGIGGMAAGQGAERDARNDSASRMYGIQQSGALANAQLQEGATRDRADRSMSAPQQRTKQILISQILRNLQPRTISGLPAGVSVPTTAGGRLQALRSSPQALAGLQRLTDTAETAMTSGSDIPTMPGSALIPPPTYQGAGRLESVGSTVGSIGTMLEALRRRRAGGR